MSCKNKMSCQNHVTAPCKTHAKPMQNPCKNHAKSCETRMRAARTLAWRLCRASGAAGWRLLCRAGSAAGRRLLCQAGLAICAICAIWLLQGKPLNIHSPPAPCYMCYMCYMALTKGKPLNLHSRVLAICAICAIWYRSLYFTHSISNMYQICIV